MSPHLVAIVVRHTNASASAAEQQRRLWVLVSRRPRHLYLVPDTKEQR